MSIVIIYFICFIIQKWLINCDTNSNISFPYNIRDNSVYVKLFIGSSSQTAYIKLTLTGEYPLISKDHYSISRSSTWFYYKTQFIMIDNFNIKCEVINDSFSFYEDQYMQNVTFYLADLDFRNGHLYLPFSYHFPDYNYSILHVYKRTKVIDRLRFYIEGQEKGGYVHLGKLPKEVEENNTKNKGKCEIENRTWGCKFKGVRVGDKIYKENRYALLSTEIEFIKAPEDIMKFLFYNLFEPYIKNDICTYNTYSFSPFTKSFSCKCNLLNDSFPNITIMFGNYGFILGYKDLFKQVFNSCTLIIQNDENSKDSYIIGYSFITKYVSKFDYDESSVTFMSQSRNIIKYYTRNDFILPTIRLLAIDMILLILSTLYSIYVKIRFIIT